MIAITSATTKSELVDALKKSTAKVRKANAELADRIKYATGMFAKDEKKVTKKDLLSLLAEADKALAIPASASTEKPKATPSTKEKPKAQLKKADSKNNKVEDLKKPASKPSAQKEEPKKADKPAPKKDEAKKSSPKPKPKKDVTPVQKEAEETDFNFPETITIETEDGEVEYKLAEGFNKFSDLEKYLSDEDNAPVVFVVPMTKKQAKLLHYGWDLVPLPKDGFPNDLDVYVPIFVGATSSIIHAVSLYTDCPMQILNFKGVDEVEEIENTRFVGNGIAYQIYVEA